MLLEDLEIMEDILEVTTEEEVMVDTKVSIAKIMMETNRVDLMAIMVILIIKAVDLALLETIAMGNQR